MEHSEEKENLSKESSIIGKHKYQKLRRKPVIGRMNILSSLKSCPNVIRVGDYGKGKPSLERYSVRKCRKRRQPYRRPFKC